jgi:Restriction endonuclease EcoRV
MDKEGIKMTFLQKLQVFATTLKDYVSTEDNQWTVKGFIDVFEKIYTISADTKIVSKILEIHLFSKFLEFANQNNFELILAEKQNWYPDISFVSKENPEIKFAVDLKTTYRLDENPKFCNGFTLGSHGEYFINRNSTKNIQFAYNQYFGHYCLGVLYSRQPLSNLEEVKVYTLQNLKNIPPVIKDFEFFAQEKWKIASDKRGSGNTANIGSITYIEDILQGSGIFTNLGEECFDEFWKNYGKIIIKKKREGKNDETEIEYDAKITDIKTYLQFKGKSAEWVEKNVNFKKTTGNTKDE